MIAVALQLALLAAGGPVAEAASPNLAAPIVVAATAGRAGLFGPKVTRQKFDAIKKGMTYKQVVKIIGFEGQELSSSQIAHITTVMYAWRNVGGSNMNAMFQNGKLIMKAQAGL